MGTFIHNVWFQLHLSSEKFFRTYSDEHKGGNRGDGEDGGDGGRTDCKFKIKNNDGDDKPLNQKQCKGDKRQALRTVQIHAFNGRFRFISQTSSTDTFLVQKC